MSRLDEIMEKVDKLPPFSNVVGRAAALFSNPEIEPEEIVDVIKFEPAITANVLKICNSAYYGLMRKVSSLKEAATYLGTEELLKIALANGMAEVLKDDIKGYDLKEGELFKHSIGCAIASQLLSKKLFVQNPNILFTGSLLHDIGKLILSEFVNEEYNNIHRMVVEKQCSFIEAEREILNTDHAEIGGFLADEWKFPEELKAIIKYHHEPAKGPESQQQNIEIVHVSDLLCLMSGIGIGSDGMAYRASLQQINIIKLIDSSLESLICDLITELEKVSTSYNLSN